MASAKLTDKFIEQLPFATIDKSVLYRDERTPGLLLRVGKRTKTLIFQTESKDKTIYRRLGEWDGEHVKLEDCKKLAQGFKGDLARGKNLAGKRMGVTVKAAFANFIRRRQTSQEIADPNKVSDDQLLNSNAYDYALTSWAKVVKGFYKRNFKHLADRRLATLSASADGATAEMLALHDKISERGKYEANRSMQVLRGVYRETRVLLDKSLPSENPIADFRTFKKLHEENRAERAIPFERLPSWVAAIDEIEKETPIRAAFHRLTVLTGARPGELARLLRADIDWKKRTLTMRDTKVKKMALTIPMTAAIAHQIKIAIRAGDVEYPGTPFIFPARSKSGHLSEWWQKTLPGRELGYAGRHTYTAVGDALNIRERTLKLLQGHAIPKHDTNAGYGRGKHDVDQLMRPAQRQISRKICELMRASPVRGRPRVFAEGQASLNLASICRVRFP